MIAKAIQQYHERTCVQWAPRQPNDSDYVFIGKIDGWRSNSSGLIVRCFSDVGRAGGRQELSLAHGCLEYDTAIHEMMHAVGFYHEHERWDRDNFIDIQWQNIERSWCKKIDRTRDRTWNLLLRRQAPYPLGHTADE